jgi:hypothetical protein
MNLWDELIGFIKGGKVVPVIGPDLLTVQVDGREVLLYPHLARRLATELGVDTSTFTPDFSINQVTCKYLQERNPPARIYLCLHSILQETPLAIPTTLRKLARIKPFQLFVSTTFDSLMEQALNAERFGGAARTVVYSYAPNKVVDKVDLPRDYKNLRPPVVFRLFGTASEEPNYVVTEEDTLEFVSALQLDERKPLQLFDELKNHHLLCMGTSFPDWLARFFARLARGEPFSTGTSKTMQYFADDQMRHDGNLILFLKSFGRSQLEVFPDLSPIDFVNQLSEKWEARFPFEPPAALPDPVEVTTTPRAVESTPAPVAAPVPAAAAPEEDAWEIGVESMERDAVFISYAREDETAAQLVAHTLEEAGIPVWLDRQRIHYAQDWADKIRRNIFHCSLFCPILSHQTERRREGVFIAEWRLAKERAGRLHENEIFIVPIPIDDAPVPDIFSTKHYAIFPGGQLPSDFVRWIRKVTLKIQNNERVF